jgi:predicted thioesterase
MEINLLTGTEGRKEIIVTADKTAVAYCSGTLEIFATPSMIAFMEQTAMDSVAALLPEGFVTVGTEVSIKHFKATLPGKVVTFYSKLIQVEGWKLLFEVTAADESELIGKGTHTRYVVDKQIFIDNLNKK